MTRIHQALLDDLRHATEFYKCVEAESTAVETGAWTDAREWLRTAALNLGIALIAERDADARPRFTDPSGALIQQASKVLPAAEALGLELPLASPEVQAMPILSGKAMEELAELRRLGQLERLHKRLIGSQGPAQLDAQIEGVAMPERSRVPHTLHTQSAGSRDASDTSSCALRASPARTQRSYWLALSSRQTTVHKARPLTLRARFLLVLHPVRQWLPAPIRRLVVRTYLTASILSSCERVTQRRSAKGGDHA